MNNNINNNNNYNNIQILIIYYYNFLLSIHIFFLFTSGSVAIVISNVYINVYNVLLCMLYPIVLDKTHTHTHTNTYTHTLTLTHTHPHTLTHTAPMIFPIIFSLAKPFLAEETKKKTNILGSK